MKRIQWGAFAGIALIIIGILVFLENLGIVDAGGIVAPLVFGTGGLIFLYVYLSARGGWWPVIPGCALLGLAALIAWEAYGPARADDVGPALFLTALAASFWIIYLRDQKSWWAIIPGGVLLTVAIVAGLSGVIQDSLSGGVFFLGLAVTFLLLALLPTPQRGLRWALIPAGVMAALGIFLLLSPLGLVRYAAPVILIAVGLYFVVRLVGSARKAG